ncbi:hypothetical protein ACN94_10320 [Gordonia paraffinivorans]|uniref:hypothetical protein n=1 Tax=Gordonia paraffinivorans TaxID=175628 RepID=UPI001C9311A5|nr:hypothetical protein [Gordonia paraffinivorans]MBY4573978.1 hypothetical protein [Gordonia paraffinivorans]
MIPKKKDDAARRAQALADMTRLLNGGRTHARATLARDAQRAKRSKTLRLPAGLEVTITEPETEEEVERDREVIRDLMVRSDLVRLGFSSMRVHNRHSFGWRMWEIDSAGRLRSPMFDTGRAVDHPSIVADCPHGNLVPSPSCRCGVYYVAHWYPFRHAVDDLLHGDFTGHAVTWGVAIGGVDVDPGGDQWGIRPRRTGRFRILGGLCHEDAPQPELPVPWRRGVTDRDAFAIEKLWDLGAPSNFHDVVARYQGEEATSFNADDVEDPGVTAWDVLRRLDDQ